MSGVLSALVGTLKPGFADVVWTSPTVFSQTMFGSDAYPGGGGWYGFFNDGFYYAFANATLTVSQTGQSTPTISVVSTSGSGGGGLNSQTELAIYTYPPGTMSITLRATGAGGKFTDKTFSFSAY